MERPPVFVTSRPEKAKEASRLGFALECVSLDLAEPQALDPISVVDAKARSAFEKLRRPVVVDSHGAVDIEASRRERASRLRTAADSPASKPIEEVILR